MIDGYGGRPAAGYTPGARWLHWITAALVLFLIPAGIYIANIEDGPYHNQIYDLHKSVGFLILPLVLVRLVYRLTHTPPPLPADIPMIQQIAAHVNHWGLYVMLILQPLIGWIGTSAYPAPVKFFGLFEWPRIWREDREFSETMLDIHGWIGIVIALFVLAHIGAALFHHFVRRDGVLTRMVRG